ncbi:hypothetical protein Tco_0295773 [Tanacetum coccineum]
MQLVNTEILKENQNLRNEPKELTSITKAWLDSSKKVNQCISEQIPTQKWKILGIDQLTGDTSSSRPKDLVFVKSSADNSEVSITGSNKPKLSETKFSTLSNHDTGKLINLQSVAPLPPLEKLSSAKPISGPKTIKSILKSKSTFKAETLKGITINEPSSAPARGNKSSSVSKTDSTPVEEELNLETLNTSRKNCETCDSNVHTTSDHNDIEWFRKREALQSKKAESFKASKIESSNAIRSKTPTKKYEMSMIGVLTYFLKFQIKKPKRGISINKEKNVNDLLRMYDKIGSSVNTLIMPPNMLGPNLNSKAVNEAQYRAKALENSKVSFSIPTGGIFGEVVVFMIGYEEEVSAKGTLRKSLLPPRVPQGTKPGAKPGHKKNSSSKQPSISSKEATKGGSSKAPTGSKTSHSKKRKESSSAMDSNPSQTLIFTLVDPGMHKEDQQANGGPTSLGVTSEARANPQPGSGMSSFSLNEPIYSIFFIIHSESALGNDASAAFTAEVDLGNYAPSDFVPQQQGMNEGTKTLHMITYLQVNSVASQIKEETSSTIKLEDLVKLVSYVQPSFKDLDLPKVDHVIVVNDSDEVEDDEVHATENFETEDTLSQEYKLKLKKNKAEAALLKAQPSFPNVEQLKELLVKSLKTEFLNILSAYDFSGSLPTELKDLPSKFNDLTEEVKRLKNQVHNLEIKLPGELKEIPSKLEDFTKIVTSLTSQVAELKTLQWELPAEFLDVPSQVEMVQAKLKTLDALLSLLNKVTNALNQFDHVITSKKTRDDSVPSAGQAGTQPAEGEKNTNQATISQLFQRRAEKEHMNKQQPKPTTPSTTPIITTTTTQMQSPFPQSPPKGSSQTEGKHIKKDKGKKALSSKEVVKESIESGSNNDETHLSGSMVESSRIKKVKKFDFVTEDGKRIHLTEEQINQQKKIEEEAKAEAAKRESEVRKEELIDLLGPEVVNKYYNDKLQYDRYYNKMLNRRAVSKITNYDVLTKKGPITLKVYREDGTSEIIPTFKASDLHLGEWREVMKACPNRTGKG